MTTSALSVQSTDRSAAEMVTGEECLRSQNYNFHIASFGSGEMQENLEGVEIPEIHDFSYDEADEYNFHIAGVGSGEMQEDLKGVEIPENPDYGYDEADSYDYGYDKAGNYDFGYDEANKINIYDYPRTYRMSMKNTEDKCSRAMGAECNDKIVALTRARRGMTRLV